MTVAVSSSPELPAKPPKRAARSPFPPLLTWVAVLAAALALSATRVPYFASSATFPRPAETLGLGLMLIVQIAASAMLFPFLLRDARVAGLVIAASWPFTFISGFLAGQLDPYVLTPIAAFITAWLIGLTLWSNMLRSPRAQATGVCAALFVAVGTLLLWYLRAEYVPQGPATGAAAWSPFFSALALAQHAPQLRPASIFAAAHLSVAMLAWSASHVGRRK
jgi:hypothetical protein